MVLAEDSTMSRTDEVNRLTENVYKVRTNLTPEESFAASLDGGIWRWHGRAFIPQSFTHCVLLADTNLDSDVGFPPPHS